MSFCRVLSQPGAHSALALGLLSSLSIPKGLFYLAPAPLPVRFLLSRRTFYLLFFETHGPLKSPECHLK